MVTSYNLSCPTDQSEMYGNTGSLCCVTGTNIVLWVNYISKTNHLPEKEIRSGMNRGEG